MIIHDGHNIAGADVGITTGDCLRVVERQPGNFLPTTGEEGGFSAFSELTDHGTRLAASITDHARLANGDGTFFRVKMEVVCDDAAPEVKVTFAQLAAIADPSSPETDILGYSMEQGNVSLVSDTVTVKPGAVVATPAPVPTLAPITAVTAPAISQNTILISALAVMGFAIVGIIALLFVTQRSRRTRKRA